MSNLNGSADPQTLAWMEMSADVLLTMSSFTISALLFEYGLKKADGLARRGTFTTATIFLGIGVYETCEILFSAGGLYALHSYFKLTAAVVAVCMVLVLLQSHNKVPSLKIAGVLERRNRELESENVRLANERDEAERNQLLSKAFLANVSHELRTPLSAVIGMHELLESSKLDAEQCRIAAAIGNSASAMLELVDDVQELTTILAGHAELEITPFEAHVVVRDACSMCMDSARVHKLFLNTDVDPRIPAVLLGDARLIVQVLTTLIKNAIKYTDKGGITVHAGLDEYFDDKSAVLRFSVKDTGVGLAEDEQTNIFQPFNNVDRAKARRYRATGLGLYMSKLIVELMGGTISVESKKGAGATFQFTLKLSSAERQPAPVPAPISHPQPLETGKPILALVVDENATLRELALRQLAVIGIEATGVENAREALELAMVREFDLIFIDCQLNGLDAFEATRSIRKSAEKSGRHAVIVATTADLLLGDEKRCRESGIDDVMIKPISVNQLRQKLRTWHLLA